MDKNGKLWGYLAETMLPILLVSALATVYLEERFDDGWESRWKRPDVIRKGIQVGKVRVSAGSFYGDEKIQRGLETLEARRHYLLYTNFSHVFDTRGKDLIVQYTLRLDIYLDCAGQYVKLFPTHVQPSRLSNESEYSLMFGPDICGAVKRQTHVIFGKNGTYYRMNKRLPCRKDHLTHSYTLILRRNGTIEVLFDGELYDQELLRDRFAIPNVTEIPDPSSVKPADWDDDPYIIDQEDVKPSDWVDEEFTPDPDSFRPPAWEDSIPWTPPLIKNPKFKGPWRPRTIPNPNYKGPWFPKTIPVKEPVPDPTFGMFSNLAFLGLEFYQSAPGSIFDNFLVTDDEEYAKTMLQEVFLDIRDAELKAYDRMVGKITADKVLESSRNNRIEKMKEKSSLEGDMSEGEKAKETPEQKKQRLREAKRSAAKKRADQKAGKFADFDSL
jgi:calreticulin